MTLDAEYDASNEQTLYWVGGLANQGSGNEAFLYSFVDGTGTGECGLRHSYRITRLNLGVQGVSIAHDKLWAVGLTEGQEGIGVSGSTNILIRVSKNDPTADPEFFHVDFQGEEAGSVASR